MVSPCYAIDCGWALFDNRAAETKGKDVVYTRHQGLQSRSKTRSAKQLATQQLAIVEVST